MDPFQRDIHANLSMREKSNLKRRINREHNSNFRAGYININENYLHKTGLRGRKRYFLYCVIAFLIFLAIVNAMLTAGIMYTLKFSHLGVQSLEFLPDSGLLHVMADTTLTSIRIFDGLIGGRQSIPLVMESKNSSIVFDSKFFKSAGNPDSISVSLGPDSTVIETDGEFKVTDENTGDALFSLDKTTTFYVPVIDTTNLHAAVVETPYLTDTNEEAGIVLQSFEGLNVTGMEGVHVESKGSVFIHTDDFISIHSMEGHVTLDGASGVFLDPNLPSVTASSKIDPNIQTYKVCVCMPSGKVFTVPVTGPGIGCRNVDPSNDPCL